MTEYQGHWIVGLLIVTAVSNVWLIVLLEMILGLLKSRAGG